MSQISAKNFLAQQKFYKKCTFFVQDLYIGVVESSNKKYLNLSNQKIVDIGDELRSRADSLADLTRLDLSSNKLSNLPKEICGLKNLQSLDLSNNSLERLPSEIGALKKLHRLRLAKNKLSSLPEEICELQNLQSLDLSDNELVELPSGIGNFKKLQKLLLRHNRKLKELPEGLGKLESLEVLDLEKNALESLPSSIGGLRNLKRLNLNMNRLEEIPKELCELVSLRKLFFRSNDLKSLPKELWNLDCLEKIDFLGNRGLGIRFEERRKEETPYDILGYCFKERPLKSLGTELVKIAPGSFAMGSPEGEEGRYDYEGPVTRVTLTKEYWMGKYPVTQGQYEALMGDNPSYFKNAGKGAPVENVSWEDAAEFCRKLTEVEREAGRLPEGYVYRLPLEAEWEYACRAGTTGARYGELDEIAWYNENSDGKAHPVGEKKPNEWGLYDMLGNVWEWCMDEWRDRHPGGEIELGSVEVQSASDVKGESRSHVMRGGSWFNFARNCRSACRCRFVADIDIFRGFRFVLAPGQEREEGRKARSKKAK